MITLSQYMSDIVLIIKLLTSKIRVKRFHYTWTFKISNLCIVSFFLVFHIL